MSPKAVELRPDRKKLRSSFDGYKLNLDAVPLLKYEVAEVPERVTTTDKQYSFLHAQLFGLHNHLVRDPWQPGAAYYIDTNWTIQKVQYDVDTGKLKPVQSVMKLAKNSAQDRYPTSMLFVSESLCVVGDGCGRLVIAETGNRHKNDEFKARYNGSPIGGEYSEGFVVRDARFDKDKEKHTLSCICVYIQQTDEHFETIANWVLLKCEDTIWKVEDCKVFKTRGALTYVGIEPQAGGALVVTDYPVDFLSNLNKIKELKQAEAQNGASKEDLEAMEKDIVSYSWSQTEEDISINFNKREECCKQDYMVQVTKDSILVKCQEEVLLTGSLFGSIDTDSTTWTTQNNYLQILLIKDTQASWPFLVSGGPDEQLHSTAPNIATLTNPAPVCHLQDQMEACDFGEFGEERENYLSRLVWQDELVSHQVYLSCPPLFEVFTKPGFPASVALKHDVDACIWSQRLSTDGDWTMEHEDTIDAFSYVQASKQQKKFTACAPDTSYAVICEPERHIFIYKKAYEGAANLRNRSGHQVNIGQQKLVVLENTGEIIGISAEKDVILLLTTSHLICLQLCTE